MLREDLIDLSYNVKWYYQHGYQEQCEAAARHAQSMTRAFIERLHPDTGLGGHDLRQSTHATVGTQAQVVGYYTNNLIQKGSFSGSKYGSIRASNSIYANIYANYFARWYNTGAKHMAQMRKGNATGWRGGDYQGRSIFKANEQAIAQYFAQQVEEYLKKHINLKGGGKV